MEQPVGAEQRRAHRGVEAVGADHDVELAGARSREPDLYPAVPLDEVGDHVAEDVLGVVPGRVVQHPGQVAAEDLDLGDLPVTVVVVG